jgi:ribosomal protein S12 methylthiotransferase accessory factor
MDRALALAKAVGEGVERYCGGLVDPRRLRRSTFREAPFPCVPPSRFALYSADQHDRPGFPFAAFGQDTLVRWIEATDLAERAIIHVPAAKVFVPYPHDEAAGERPIAQSITTGLAAHSTFEEACIGAICEVVERDAFTIMWQARLTMPGIRVESLSEPNRDLAVRLTPPGARLRLLNLTMDHGIPTVLCVLRCASPGMPALAFAAAADLDPEVAVGKSLEEMELMRSFAMWIRTTKRSLSEDASYDAVTTREDHVSFHANHRNVGLSDFVVASTESHDIRELPNLATGEPRRDLEILTERIAAVGESALIVDLTSDDVGALGIKVVRAIVPGFHPLVFGHGLRALGGTRLWTVPQNLGYAGITKPGGDNPAPHPFP